MKIIRDGKEYELTAEEMYKTFMELQEEVRLLGDAENAINSLVAEGAIRVDKDTPYFADDNIAQINSLTYEKLREREFSLEMGTYEECVEEALIDLFKKPSINVGDFVCVNVRNLVHFRGLSHASCVSGLNIRKVKDYFDLYWGDELICVEGEVCKVIGKANGYYYLRNIEVDHSCVFKLTEREAEEALEPVKELV